MAANMIEVPLDDACERKLLVEVNPQVVEGGRVRNQVTVSYSSGDEIQDIAMVEVGEGSRIADLYLWLDDDECYSDKVAVPLR